MKAVLIDDEYYALQGLKMRLDEIGGIDVAGLFTSGKQALENIEAIRPDVVFLDIEMPNMSGIELFSRIVELLGEVKIVFTTAYAQYAVEAFELNALDYIVKPIEKDRLLKTLERIETVKSPSTEDDRKTSVNCFGKLSVVIGGKEVNLGLRRKSEELLAFLICAEGRFVAKEKIMEALWPEVDKDKASNNLYVAFYNLKRQPLGALTESLESVRGKMRLRQDETIECDLYDFKQLARHCISVGQTSAEAARKAIELYRGALFEEDYYDWAALPQAELEILYLELLEKTITYCNERGDDAGARYLETKRARYESV